MADDPRPDDDGGLFRDLALDPTAPVGALVFNARSVIYYLRARVVELETENTSLRLNVDSLRENFKLDDPDTWWAKRLEQMAVQVETANSQRDAQSLLARSTGVYLDAALARVAAVEALCDDAERSADVLGGLERGPFSASVGIVRVRDALAVTG